MSHQVRFKIKNIWYKVRLFIIGSNRLPCICCGTKADGVKFRHIEPKKVPDGLICHECLVKLSHGLLVAVDPALIADAEKQIADLVIEVSKKTSKKKTSKK